MKQTASELISQEQTRALEAAIDKVTEDPFYISSVSGGGPVEDFEKAFAHAVGARYALALSSCTAALHTALMVYDIGPGDEVIVTSYTWGQSVAPVLFVGATPVFADIKIDTLTIDPKCIEEHVSSRTKAIIPVHIFGIPAEMNRIISIAEKYNLAVISDSAQAFGALSRGQKLGSLGDINCYSIGPGKLIYGGEGGVLVTNNRFIYERAIALTQHPMRSFKEVSLDVGIAYDDQLGWNYRIHPMAAILALPLIKNAKKIIGIRQMKIQELISRLDPYPQLQPILCNKIDESAAYGLPLRYIPENSKCNSREDFIKKQIMHKFGIYIGPIRTPIHRRVAFSSKDRMFKKNVIPCRDYSGVCPNCEQYCSNQELYIHSDDLTTD